MSTILVHIIAVALSSLLALGMLEGRLYRSWRRALWSQLCWSVFCGSGFYGLICYDGQWLQAPFSYFSLFTIAGLTALTTIAGYFHTNRGDYINNGHS